MKKVFVFATIILVAIVLLNQHPTSHPVAAKVASSSLSMLADHSARSLIRINQMDPAQYASTDEYNTWAASVCSAASMTEVIDFYAQRTYTIHDILMHERSSLEITPELGLLEEAGIAKTVGQLGFNTDWGHMRSLQQVIDVANGGRPVIVSIPPQRDPDFYGGHILVLLGGDATSVFVADSSVLNKHSFSRDEFTVLWSGFSAIITPGGQL